MTSRFVVTKCLDCLLSYWKSVQLT